MFADPEVWVAIAFLLFVAVFVWKGLKPLLAALDARAERIRGQLAEAHRLREDAEQALSEAERKSREAQRSADEIIEHARDEAKRLEAQAAQNLQATLERRERNALDKIAQAEAKAVKEVQDQAVDAAIAAARTLLTRQVDGAKGDRLVAEAISEIGKRLN